MERKPAHDLAVLGARHATRPGVPLPPRIQRRPGLGSPPMYPDTWIMGL